VQVKVDQLKGIMSYCVHEPALRFDLLECLTALDVGSELAVIYHLRSMTLSHRLNVKVTVPRHNPTVPTMTCFWRAARSHELEAAEMLGLVFEGHPSPRHLLLPDDWYGFPLRKDYVYPEEYHDLEHRRAPLRKEHAQP
jgi:NADH:ubiquinone oxidoreductase subunit C